MNRFNKTDKITLKTYTPYHSTIKLLKVINSIEMHWTIDQLSHFYELNKKKV